MKPGEGWTSSWAAPVQPGVAAWPLQGSVPWGGSGQDSSQPTCGPAGVKKDVSVELNLELQGAIEVILRKYLFVLAQEGADTKSHRWKRPL